MFNFEKLKIYQDTLILIKELYELTKKFPKSEQYALCSQLRRASTSIALNIAEGTGRTRIDNINFLRFAKGSIFEIVTILQISKSINYITNELYNSLYNKCERLAKMISSFINTLR